MNVSFSEPIAFHQLIGPHGLMTTDQPNEQYTQWVGFREAAGHVLVSGLGLGMVVGMILKQPGVKSVTVVEKQSEVIALTTPYLQSLKTDRVRVVHQDIFKFLDARRPAFYDFAYHDIWYGTNEGTWAEIVVPLWSATRRAGINQIGGWCEREMQGQLFTGLFSAAFTYPHHEWKPYRVFLDALECELGRCKAVEGDEERVAKLIKF